MVARGIVFGDLLTACLSALAPLVAELTPIAVIGGSGRRFFSGLPLTGLLGEAILFFLSQEFNENRLFLFHFRYVIVHQKIFLLGGGMLLVPFYFILKSEFVE